jgi:hypothetical protein
MDKSQRNEQTKKTKKKRRRKGGIPWKSGTPIILSCTSLRGEATFKEVSK